MSSLWQRAMGPKTIAASSSSQAGLNTSGALPALFPAVLTLLSATETVVPHPDNASIAFALPLPGNKGLEQIPFNLIASGIITTNSTTNVTAKLLSGTSLTVGSDTSLGASTATAVNTTTTPFRIKAELIYDSVSGKLHGEIEFLINNSITAKAALANVVTGLNNANDPVATFVLSFTSSGADSTHATVVSIKNFSVG